MLTTMLFANDHDALVDFYRHVFDLSVEETGSSPGYTVLHADGIRISIHGVPPEVAAQIPIADPPEPRSRSACKLLFDVTDVAAMRELVLRHGGQVLETAGAGDDTDAVDVEGNVFRLMPAG
jgi:predicted enzyme related to lactoylglutathione lyase